MTAGDSSTVKGGAQSVDAGLDASRSGLIVANHGQKLLVAPYATIHIDADIEALPELEPASLFRCKTRSNLPVLVAGDRIVFQPELSHDELIRTGVITAMAERRSLLSRPDKFGKLKPVAANVDRICVVLAPLPEPHFNLTDRYIVAAEVCGVRPLIIFNKADLLGPETGIVGDMQTLYNSLGYECVLVSAHEPDSLAALHQVLRGQTAILCGQSGVGKSALARCLTDAGHDVEIAVGKLSDATDKGRHTTTAARLYPLASGEGYLIDSPGIREFGLWHLDQADLAYGFVEFRPLLGLCRFSDCSHTHEPGCALLDAVASGIIDSRRWNSYRGTAESLDNFEIRPL